MKQTNFHLQEKKYSTSDRQKSLRPVKDKHVEFSETVGFPENNVNYGGNRIPQLIPEDQSTLTDSCNIREMEIRCLNNNLTQDIELDENGPRTNELGPRLTHVSVSVSSTTMLYWGYFHKFSKTYKQKNKAYISIKDITFVIHFYLIVSLDGFRKSQLWSNLYLLKQIVLNFMFLIL